MIYKSKVQNPKRMIVDQRLKTKSFILFVFVLFAVFACTDTKTRRDGIVIAHSKKYEATLYRQNCAICHGREAYGKSVDGKPVPSLRFGDVKEKTKTEIYQQIINGKLPMPSFKNQLTEKEINLMVDFIMYDLQARDREKVSGKDGGKLKRTGAK